MLLQLPVLWFPSSCNNTPPCSYQHHLKLFHQTTFLEGYPLPHPCHKHTSTLTMSSVQMVSASAINFKVPYKILGHEDPLSDDERYERVNQRPKKWGRPRGVPLRRRFRVKVGSWRRVWMIKKMMLVCAKVKKRFKEGQGHFGELFAGNYVFTQINPTSLKYLEKKLAQAKVS